MKIWMIVGAAFFMLPLCAADPETTNKQSYADKYDHIIWETVIQRKEWLLTELRKLCTVNKHMKSEASKLLDQERVLLKQFVDKNYHITDGGLHTLGRHYKVTYSPDRLSAAIVTTAGIAGFFTYVYRTENRKATNRDYVDFQALQRQSTYPPFFTHQHACLDFVTPLETGWFGGLCWNRSTKQYSDARFWVALNGKRYAIEIFAKTLPRLCEKLAYESYPSYATPILTFTMDPVESGVLTANDATMLSKFLPGGKHATWYAIKKPKPNYLLLNLLAHYGKDTDILDNLERCIGKYEIRSPEGHIFTVSCCRDIISFRKNKADKLGTALSDRFDPQSSIIAQATLNYVERLKKELVFVKQDWQSNKTTPPFKKRLKYWQQAAAFLTNKRMAFIPQGDTLMRHDCESNTVTLFRCTSNPIKKIICPVPQSMDPRQMHICNDGRLAYFDHGKVVFQSLVTIDQGDQEASDCIIELSDAESSDPLVKSSDD